MKSLIVLSTLLFSQAAFSGVLQTQAGTKQMEGITLSKSATYSSGTGNVELQMVGAGLRKKKVLVVTAKVYVAQLFLSSPQAFKRTDSEALASASSSQVAAMQLTFLRDVEAAKVQTSFVDALQANNVNTQQADVRDFLAAVNNSGDAKAGKNLTIVVSKDSAGNETLIYEDTVGKVSTVKGTPGLSQKVLSIWLGRPADKELGEAKAQILSGQ
jgi:hypothetical protein